MAMLRKKSVEMLEKKLLLQQVKAYQKINLRAANTKKSFFVNNTIFVEVFF